MRKAALGLLLVLNGCASLESPSGSPAPSPAPSPTSQPAPLPREPAAIPPTRPQPPLPQGFLGAQVLHMPGLEEVIEQDARSLVRMFGTPRLDVKEGDMRKLQFAGDACVLDVFLYPLRPNAEPVATYVDARRASGGLDVERAACVAALKRQPVRP